MPDRQSQTSTDTSPISILACGGRLPLEVAEILRDTGRRTNIVSIKGMADADFSRFGQTSVGILQIGALLTALRAHGAREMIIAGHARRPNLKSLSIDWGFIQHFSTIWSLTRGGDDHVLRRIAVFFERRGLTVRSIADVAPTLLTTPGALAGTQSTDTQSDAQLGLRLVHQLGPFDVGQAVIVQNGRALAIEGAEGTDGLLDRVSDPKESPLDATLSRTLVKAAKPEQDLRIDLPTIGPATIEKCKQAGIQHIALEAERSLIVSRTETLNGAEAAGISIVGLETKVPTATSPSPKSSIRLTSHARQKPKKQQIRDAAKGLRLLFVTSPEILANAAIVTRENILSINVQEPLAKFIARTEKLVQWGDKPDKQNRNRTLVLNSVEDLPPTMLDCLQNTRIAGVALLHSTANPAKFDQLVSDANVRELFVLSPECA